jgi:hypothetical protein
MGGEGGAFARSSFLHSGGKKEAILPKIVISNENFCAILEVRILFRV